MYHVVLTDTAPAKERHMKSLRHAAGASLAVVAVAVSGCTYASEESAAPEGNSSNGGPSSSTEIIGSIKKDPTLAAVSYTHLRAHET